MNEKEIDRCKRYIAEAHKAFREFEARFDAVGIDGSSRKFLLTEMHKMERILLHYIHDVLDSHRDDKE